MRIKLIVAIGQLASSDMVEGSIYDLQWADQTFFYTQPSQPKNHSQYNDIVSSSIQDKLKLYPQSQQTVITVTFVLASIICTIYMYAQLINFIPFCTSYIDPSNTNARLSTCRSQQICIDRLGTRHPSYPSESFSTSALRSAETFTQHFQTVANLKNGVPCRKHLCVGKGRQNQCQERPAPSQTSRDSNRGEIPDYHCQSHSQTLLATQDYCQGGCAGMPLSRQLVTRLQALTNQCALAYQKIGALYVGSVIAVASQQRCMICS